MNVSLVLFLLVMAFFAYRGYKKGLLRSLSRVISLIAGYTASILFTEQVSAFLTSQFQLEGLISFIAAALILFVTAGIAVIIVFWIIAQLVPVQETPSTPSALGGMFVGLLVGFIVAIISVWSFTFIRDFLDEPEPGALAQPDTNKIENLASRVVGKAATTAMSLSSVDPEVSRLSAAIIKQPGRILQHAQRLMNSNELQSLLADPQTQAILSSGDVYALQQLPAFQQLHQNADFLALAESTGMLTEPTAGNVSSETLLATRMTEIWSRVDQVKNDSRVQDILNDPEFRQKVMAGNPVDLLTNPRLLELANIIFSNPATSDATENATEVGSSAETPTDENKQKPSEKATKIYSWTDENGQIHISDIKPESGS